jgi:hypothetical protein
MRNEFGGEPKVGRPKAGRCCSLKLSGKHARSVLVVIHPKRGNHKKGAVALEEAEAGGEAGVKVVAVMVMQEAGMVAESVTRDTFSVSNVTSMATMQIAALRRRRTARKLELTMCKPKQNKH